MAAPMRSGHPQDGQGHRARVADSCKGATAARGPHQPSAGQPQQHQPNQPAATAANFEYDDNEWDIGIGDLIIDLDADIEKTNEQQQPVHGTGANMAANTGSGPQASKTAATAKMHIEHSATADKGLKMKIKRTKPGTKTSEAKHEIVKSNEQNGATDGADLTKGSPAVPTGSKHALPSAAAPLGASGTLTTNNSNPNSQSSAPVSTNTGKRGSSGHRRDKTSRDKHVHSNSSSSAGSVSPLTTSNSSSSSSSSDKPLPKTGTAGSASPSTMSGVLLPTPTDMNGLLRTASAPQTGPPRSVFPASTGPGPPPPSPGPPASPAAATAQGSAAKPEQSKVGVSGSGSGANSVSAGGAVVISAGLGANNGPDEQHRTNNSGSPTPSKKIKLSDSAVLASQQAAAVTVINPYPTK
ncbi:hypothetical protein HUJ04_004530 [Dendroctonus ponderosae]|nr:hypothetical protein HUJ04_004530 [Dendroctonus ponderosae]